MVEFTPRSKDAGAREIKRDLDRLEAYFNIKGFVLLDRSFSVLPRTIKGVIRARDSEGYEHKNTFEIPISDDGSDEPLENSIISCFYPDLDELVPVQGGLQKGD